MSGLTSVFVLCIATTCILDSCVTARAVKDDSLLDKPQDVPSTVTFTDPRLSQLLQLFLDTQRVNARDEDSISSPFELEVKRAWDSQEWPIPSSMKRKMFWTPLGHMPASARLGQRPQAINGPNMDDTGSPVFRYG